MLRSSTAIRCRTQLSQRTKTIHNLQARANSTSAGTDASASNNAADVPVKPTRRHSSIPLASNFGDVKLPEGQQRRVAHEAKRRVASSRLNPTAGSNTLSLLLKNRRPVDAQETFAAQSSDIRVPDINRKRSQQRRDSMRTERAGGTESPRGNERARRTERAGGTERYRGNQTNNNASLSREDRGPRNQNQNTRQERRPRPNKKGQVDGSATSSPPDAKDCAIEISSDLDSMFATTKPALSSITPAPRKVVKDAPAGPAESSDAVPIVIPHWRLQYALEHDGGDYSRHYTPRYTSIRGDSIKTLGPVGLAQQVIGKKAEVGVKPKGNAIEVVSKLVAKGNAPSSDVVVKA